MNPPATAFNLVASPMLEEQLRLQGWIILYWILLIDADDRHEKEKRSVRDRQNASHEQQRRKHRPRSSVPAL